MDSLILQDYRCFHGYQEIPLAPLTILVGENSTGKSSVLAAVRISHDLTQYLVVKPGNPQVHQDEIRAEALPRTP